MANHLKMAKAQAIQALREQGWSYRRIARTLRISRVTGKRHVELGQARAAPPTGSEVQSGPNQILRVLEPAGMELYLAAADDMEREQKTLEEHWRLRLERSRYATDRAARQYHAVEPENRLVARELERRWEQCIREQQVMKEEYERFHEQRPAGLSDVQRDQIRALATNVLALWRSEECSQKDRQDIIRHVIDKIVVNSIAGCPILEVAIHFAGGFIAATNCGVPWDAGISGIEYVTACCCV